MPVVKAEASQVETDQAPELEATEVAVRVLPVAKVKALPVVKRKVLLVEPDCKHLVELQQAPVIVLRQKDLEKEKQQA